MTPSAKRLLQHNRSKSRLQGGLSGLLQKAGRQTDAPACPLCAPAAVIRKSNVMEITLFFAVVTRNRDVNAMLTDEFVHLRPSRESAIRRAACSRRNTRVFYSSKLTLRAISRWYFNLSSSDFHSKAFVGFLISPPTDSACEQPYSRRRRFTLSVQRGF